MKSRHLLFSIAVLTGYSVICAAEPPHDPIHAHLHSPELLLGNRNEIGLTEKQVERIQAHLEREGPKVAVHQNAVAEATRGFAELLSAKTIDEPAAMKQLDEVLAAEEVLKRLHLRIIIRINNELTAEQRQLAAKIKQAPPIDGLEQRLRSKLTRIKKEIARRADSGQPPFDAVELMQSFPEKMQAGRHAEAEAVLDRVMKTLELEMTEKPNAEKQGGLSTIRRVAIAHLPGPLSFEAIQEQVNGLKKDDVAWRKIQWKTCLLDGLQASRQQNKPIMLWIFIDRPIDDERC